MVVEPRETSYLDAVRGSDGTICMGLDRGRTTFREILCSQRYHRRKTGPFDSCVRQIIGEAPASPWNVDAVETVRVEVQKVREFCFT